MKRVVDALSEIGPLFLLRACLTRPGATWTLYCAEAVVTVRTYYQGTVDYRRVCVLSATSKSELLNFLSGTNRHRTPNPVLMMFPGLGFFLEEAINELLVAP